MKMIAIGFQIDPLLPLIQMSLYKYFLLFLSFPLAIPIVLLCVFGYIPIPTTQNNSSY